MSGPGTDCGVALEGVGIDEFQRVVFQKVSDAGMNLSAPVVVENELHENVQSHRRYSVTGGDRITHVDVILFGQERFVKVLLKYK